MEKRVTMRLAATLSCVMTMTGTGFSGTGSFGQDRIPNQTNHSPVSSPKPDNLIGTYRRRKSGKDDENNSYVEVKQIHGDKVQISLSALAWTAEHRNMRSEVLEATVTLSNQVAVYKNEDYRLTMRFADSTIVMTESGRNPDFGTVIPVAGTYRRVSQNPALYEEKPAPSQHKVVSPKWGNPIRKTLFAAMRPAIEKDLHQKVIFSVRTLNISEGWAFIGGVPLQPDQKPLDYHKTVYWEAVQHGAFSGTYYALLHLTHGQWKLITYRLGPTDVCWEDWPQRFHAPKAIFKEEQD